MDEQFHYLMKTDTIQTAKALLGMELVLDGQTIGKIVETEAYLGTYDSACHSANGRRTPKNEAMYLSYGHWYVYQIHGYCMLNLVTKSENIAEAVLIRAVQVDNQLVANGPGKLTKYANITKKWNGEHIQTSSLYLKKGCIPKEICTRQRIGITCKDDWRTAPLCFYVAGNRHVSRMRKKEIVSDEQTWLPYGQCGRFN